MLANNDFWTRLIRRDLGVVPCFAVNMKLYYLQGMNFGVPLTVYRLDELDRRQSVVELDQGVVFLDRYFAVYNTKIINTATQRSTELTLVGRSIKKTVFYSGRWCLLITDGELLGLAGDKLPAPHLPENETITDIITFEQDYETKYTVLTKSGVVYKRKILNLTIRTPIEEPVVSVVFKNKLLTHSGSIYWWGREVEYLGWFNSDQPICESESLYIGIDGKVGTRELPTTMSAHVYTELEKYFMIDIHKDPRTDQYLFRGFRR